MEVLLNLPAFVAPIYPLVSDAFNPIYSDACNRLIALMEGPFGALITVGAGVGAIIASSVGGFRTAWTLVVVAVGAFILRAYVTLFFAACFSTCPTC